MFMERKEKIGIQQLYEELESCGERLMGYKECFEIMGKDRNSYSKTDPDATFMRMKEDAMLNGQLNLLITSSTEWIPNTSHGSILARVQPIHVP